MDQTIFTLADFNKEIESLVRSQARSAKAVGGLLLKALYFSIVEKDAGAANALINGLRKSTKQSGIIALLQEYGNLAWMKSAKKPQFEFFEADNEWTTDYVAGMREVCADWESFKPAAEKATEFDIIAALEALQKKVIAAKGKNLNIKGEPAMEAINLLVAKYHAADIDAVL